jgi:formylmethanofuran--tetrahydromethanopterin N-formyltransferase
MSTTSDKQLGPTRIEDTYAEAFRMWATRLLLTAADDYWLDTALAVFTGYGTSVIACECELGLELKLPLNATPDERPGAMVLLFAFHKDALTKVVPKRVGQCLMTCPTLAVYDGMPDAADRLPLGKHLRYFGDGHQKSKVIGGRRYWRIPVMEGEFICEETAGAVKAIGGGNILIEGIDLESTLAAARRAVAAVATLPDAITPFPGGVVRSGSKVGSRYPGLVASTNDEYAPALRSRCASKVHPDAHCVLEIVINGLSESAIGTAMRAAMAAASGPGIPAIAAGNYGGTLGKFHFPLHKVLAEGGA